VGQVDPVGLRAKFDGGPGGGNGWLAPGYVGLYRVKIPAATPPEPGVSLTLIEGGSSAIPWRSNEEKMGFFGAKLLTRGCPAWFNRASVSNKGLKGGGRPVSHRREGISLDMGRAMGYE
jgi:hypothetical protein